MTFSRCRKLPRSLYAALLCCLLPAASALAQQPTPTPAEQTDEIIRVNTELVQTDVMVFDKQGRFVDNLKPEQFELRVDGKPQPVTFFDRVTAGSATEESQLAAARGQARPAQEATNSSSGAQSSVGLFDRGRVVVFFIDDLHLAFDSVKRTQKVLLHFINDEMGQNDRVAITTAGGQLGFLQQLTDNKAVLRAAVARLSLRPQLGNDTQQPPMSEYLALQIMTRGNTDVLSYFVEQLIKQGTPSQIATDLVKARAGQILRISHSFTRNTFFSLASLARTISVVPGRKLVFFISDGFLLNSNESDVYDQLWSITNTAARNSVVIYTLDARGLSTPSIFDAASPGGFDATGRIMSATLGENSAQQEALRTLAANTGGRALLNTNALDTAISKTLKETSTYYVIAWRPETEEQKKSKLRRIEVKITGHSDYKVQVKSGFLTPAKEPEAKPAPAEKAKPAKVKTPNEQLGAAINSFYPASTLPTSLALDYMDAPQGGAMLNISMQVPAEALSFDPDNGKYKAALDIGINVYNTEGKVGATFQEHLNVNADTLDLLRSNENNVYYTSRVHLNPGLYQVRVAARDAKSGHIGVATQWVEVPDLKSKRLAMSSLFIGELTREEAARPQATTTDAAIPTAKLNVARRFPKTSRLRFLTFIYNAQRGGAGTSTPDVAIQVQVLRDEQPVVTTALRKVTTNEQSDFGRLPYAAEIPLDNMPAGHYLLQVTVIDRIAKTSAAQQLSFAIE